MNMSETGRIRWHCRRGMLELDLVLQTFLDRHFDRLDTEQRAALERLLEYPDNDLLDFVMGRAEPLDKRCVPLLELLRAA